MKFFKIIFWVLWRVWFYILMGLIIVVLFPLLEKELSELEYDYLKPNVNKVFVIENYKRGFYTKSLTSICFPRKSALWPFFKSHKAVIKGESRETNW